MAFKEFVVRSEPHVAKIGTTSLSFQPEVNGSTFAQAYERLRAAQRKVSKGEAVKASGTKHAREENIDVAALTELSAELSRFVRTFLYDDDSRAAFDALNLPDRVLVQLMEWTAELFGGGSGNPDADGGTSSD